MYVINTVPENSIHVIKFVYAPSETIANIRCELAGRLSLAKTIPGTRGYHQYTPSTDSSIKIKHISHDDEFELGFDFLGKKTHFSSTQVKHIPVSQYLLCKYDLTNIGLV